MDSGGVGPTETRPPTAEEEALKRNTDCVYFLASPLTCKKGSECEYRHSEGARLNPRDCYYWLKSNCLNPKCAFRHPPLDGLFGPPSSGPAPLPTVAVTSKQISAAHSSPAYNPNKQSRNDPCIFFLKGHCLKGERCPFFHGPQEDGSVVPQQVAKASSSLLEQSQMFKKEPWGSKQFVDQQNISKLNSNPALTLPVSSPKPVIRVDSSSSNGLSQAKNLLPHPLGNKLPKTVSAQAPVTNSNTWSRAQNYQIQPSNEAIEEGLEPGEIAGEYSSGFDIQVVNNMKDGSSHNRGDFGRRPMQDGRKLDHSNDYDRRSFDHKLASANERNKYSGTRDEIERNDRAQEQYALRSHGIASERSSERSVLPERRVLQRHKSPDEGGRADLRHRLKQRKLDNSKSADAPDFRDPYRRDAHYMEDKYRSRHSHRDQQHIPPESSISSRLQGRIGFPGVSSDPSFYSQSQKERDGSRHRGRLSPTRPIGNQERQYDMKRRLSEEPSLGAGARGLGGRLTMKEDIDSINFTGPKSLAELKGTKHDQSLDQSTRSTGDTCSGVRNNVTAGKEVNQGLENSSFEGPKSLSLLLKRKRDETPVGDSSSNNADESVERNESAKVCSPAITEGVQQLSAIESNNEDSSTIGEFGAANAETVEEEEDSMHSRHDDRPSVKEDVIETEDYMELDAMEDQGLQDYDQQDGESDYEATEAGDFKTEYESQGEEEDELDDEEDFARKAGLMFS